MIGSIYLNPHNVKGYPKIFPYFSSIDLYYTITALYYYYYKLSIILYFELHCKSFGSLRSLFCINASQVALMVKKPPASAGDIRDPWVGTIPWRRAWQLTPVFLPGESMDRGPGGLHSMGSHRVGHDWCNLVCSTHHMTALIFWVLKAWIFTRLLFQKGLLTACFCFRASELFGGLAKTETAGLHPWASVSEGLE